MRINFNAYYPDRKSVIKVVVIFAEIYLGRFDSRGYDNCLLVGPEPGWENGLEEMSACLASNWPFF